MVQTSLLLAGLGLKGLLRDRILRAIFGVGVFLYALVPVISLFSMRQVQELAVTLALSINSLVLIVVALLLGSASVWRDVERRYTAALLGLPLSRGEFVLGKYLSLAGFLLLCLLFFMLICVPGILIANATYPGAHPVAWRILALSMFGDYLKALLLGAVALFFSSLSTSIFLPFFCSFAVFLAGNASQQVVEYVRSDLGGQLSPCLRWLAQALYWLVPNFSAFDFEVHAIYHLPLNPVALLTTLGYWVVYTGLVLLVAVAGFGRRDLP